MIALSSFGTPGYLKMIIRIYLRLLFYDTDDEAKTYLLIGGAPNGSVLDVQIS